MWPSRGAFSCPRLGSSASVGIAAQYASAETGLATASGRQSPAPDAPCKRKLHKLKRMDPSERNTRSARSPRATTERLIYPEPERAKASHCDELECWGV